MKKKLALALASTSVLSHLACKGAESDGGSCLSSSTLSNSDFVGSARSLTSGVVAIKFSKAQIAELEAQGIDAAGLRISAEDLKTIAVSGSQCW